MAYSDEEALELLLEQTPELLPGPDTGPVAMVRQVYVRRRARSTCSSSVSTEPPIEEQPAAGDEQ